MANGTSTLSIGYNARSQYYYDQTEGRLRSISPKEGSASQINVIGAIANAAEPAATLAFIQYAISPEAQESFARTMFYAPTNTRAEVDEATRARIPMMDPEQRARLIPVDWMSIGDMRESMLRPWRRQIIPPVAERSVRGPTVGALFFRFPDRTSKHANGGHGRVDDARGGRHGRWRTSLSSDGVTKRYSGQQAAVDDLHLALPRGKLLGLLGPSGCGKTTTLRMIAGLLSVTSGHIRVSGDDISNKPPHQRDIGLVFQNYALFPHMSAAQNVAFGLEMRGVGKGPGARGRGAGDGALAGIWLAQAQGNVRRAAAAGGAGSRAGHPASHPAA